ncbi:MAG TPA: YafY family protein [Albitalea sp.]|nr:YafY family protein [Albitalea sp.]
MRASRLLSILMLLQGRGRLSAQALAEELEVSVRTIYRDVDELSASGVPVWAERGRAGGFQLQPGWRTRVDGLTASEARAMFLGGLPGPAAQLGLGEAMASAQLKLLAALPDGWREDARRVSSRFHLDPVDWFRAPAAADHLPAIAQAVWDEERIRVRYESWNATAERTLEPLGVVLKAGTWYMAARTAGPSGQDKGPRTYRLSNILELAPTGERFSRPARFDLAAFWGESTRRFEADLYHDEARLRVSPRGLRVLSAFSVAVADAAKASAGPADEQGWVEVRVPIESVEHAAGQFLRLGIDAVVLAPAALRRALRDTVRRIEALYAPPAQRARRASRSMKR